MPVLVENLDAFLDPTKPALERPSLPHPHSAPVPRTIQYPQLPTINTNSTAEVSSGALKGRPKQQVTSDAASGIEFDLRGKRAITFDPDSETDTRTPSPSPAQSSIFYNINTRRTRPRLGNKQMNQNSTSNRSVSMPEPRVTSKNTDILTTPTKRSLLSARNSHRSPLHEEERSVML